MNRVIAEPEILLPLPRFLPHWSVVACDQFTSDRGYWDALDAWAGENPSTLRLILPECYLGDDSERARREQIGRTMRDYYNGGVFTQKKEFCFRGTHVPFGKSAARIDCRSRFRELRI